MIEIPWTNLFNHTVEPEKRGILRGNQLLHGGLGALLAGYIVKIALLNPDLSNDKRYALARR